MILPVRWPAQGRNEAEAFSAQPPLTTRDELNVCDLDSTTNRMRGATRSGLEKYVSSQVSASILKRGVTVAYDGKKHVYQGEAVGDVEVMWSLVMPSKADCLAVTTDKAGNVYATDGLSGVVQVNPDGRILSRIDLPTNRKLVVRAICTDELGNVYVATSDTGFVNSTGNIYTSVAIQLSGLGQGLGDVNDSRIWKYRPLWDPEETKDEFDKIVAKHWHLEWEVNPGAFVEQIEVREGLLFTVQNIPSENTSYIVVYNDITTASPHVALKVECPHPCNGMDAKTGGIFTTHPSNSTRGIHPKQVNGTARAIDWTPRELVDYKKRIWCWFNEEGLVDAAGLPLKDGADVVTWYDNSGNGRHLICPFGQWTEGGSLGATKIIPPKLRAVSGVGALKSVVFDGFKGSTTTPLTDPIQVSGLRSGFNNTIAAIDKDQQRTMLPSYTGARFAVFMVVKPAKTSTVTQQCIFSQINNSDSNWEAMFVANAQADLTTSEGKILCRERTLNFANGVDGLETTTGLDHLPFQGTYDAVPTGYSVSPGVALVTWVNTTGGTGSSRSIWRVNGNALDRYESKAFTSLNTATSIGYRLTISGSSHLQWFSGEILEILVLDFYDDATNDVLSAPPYPGSTFSASNLDTELERIEGYLAHKFGIAHVLPTGEYQAPAGNINDSATVGVPPANWPHSFPLIASTATINPIAADAPKGGPPRATGLYTTSKKADLNHTGEILAKWDSVKGDIRWVLKSSSTIGGLGYGVVATVDGNAFTFGPKPSGNNLISRLTLDAGETPTTTDAYSYGAGGADWDYKYLRAKVNKHNCLVAPYYETGGTNHTLQVNNVGLTGFITPTPQLIDVTVGGQIQECHAVAFDPKMPKYPTTDTAGNISIGWTGTSLSDLPRPEFVYVATKLAAAGEATLHKLRLVETVPQTGANRRFKHVAVGGGDIKTFTSSAVATPTGGSAAFDSTADWIDMVAMFGKAWGTDGRRFKKYDAEADTVSAWTAKSGGKLPERCRLLVPWVGRMVMSRDPNNPTLWHMSAWGDPENWDTIEKIPGGVPTQAVSGGDPGFQPCPDIINMLAPWRDDALVFGCDHSFWLMNGDPRYGGTFQDMKVPVGAAFGHTWTVDDEGALYVFKSTGGVLRFHATGFQSITDRSIERQMESIAYDTTHVQLVWEDSEKSLHVFQEPFGSGGTALTHWRWEKRTGAWWTNQYPTSMQPGSAMVIDGDAATDRRMLLLGQDGYARSWSRTAADDDGTPIKSRVTIELEPPDERFMWRWQGLNMEFATSLHAPHVQFLTTDQAETLEDPEGDHPMQPGANDALFHPIKGRKCYVRVYGDRRWAFERGQINAYRAGRVRQRTW